MSPCSPLPLEIGRCSCVWGTRGSATSCISAKRCLATSPLVDRPLRRRTSSSSRSGFQSTKRGEMGGGRRSSLRTPSFSLAGRPSRLRRLMRVAGVNPRVRGGGLTPRRYQITLPVSHLLPRCDVLSNGARPASWAVTKFPSEPMDTFRSRRPHGLLIRGRHVALSPLESPRRRIWGRVSLRAAGHKYCRREDLVHPCGGVESAWHT